MLIGTKVRLPSAELGRFADAVATSLEGSLVRLRRDRVDIFQRIDHLMKRCRVPDCGKTEETCLTLRWHDVIEHPSDTHDGGRGARQADRSGHRSRGA